jgi:hypothetical protein
MTYCLQASRRDNRQETLADPGMSQGCRPGLHLSAHWDMISRWA